MSGSACQELVVQVVGAVVWPSMVWCMTGSEPQRGDLAVAEGVESRGVLQQAAPDGGDLGTFLV